MSCGMSDVEALQAMSRYRGKHILSRKKTNTVGLTPEISFSRCPGNSCCVAQFFAKSMWFSEPMRFIVDTPLRRNDLSRSWQRWVDVYRVPKSVSRQ